MIIEEVKKLLARGVFESSKSPGAAELLCVGKEDGTLEHCVNWRTLNSLLVIDRGGSQNVLSIFNPFAGKYHFIQLDLASGFHHLRIAEKYQHETAFRDCDVGLYEFNRAGIGLTVLPSAVTRVVESNL